MPLSISIPSAARRSFLASAPATGVDTAGDGAHGHPPATHSARPLSVHAHHPLPALHGLKLADDRQIHHNQSPYFAHAVPMVTSVLEELLLGLRVRQPQERQAATAKFRAALLREREGKAHPPSLVASLPKTSIVVATPSATIGKPVLKPNSRVTTPTALPHHGGVHTPTFLPARPMHAATVAGYTSDSFQTHLLALAGSEDVDAKWAAAAAIGEILAIHPAPDARSAVRLATALIRLIPCNDPSIMSDAARLFAALAPLEGMAALVTRETSQILEWLEESRSERKRVGAIYLLTELMQTPTSAVVVRDQAARAIQDIWSHALTDPKQNIRDGARVALEACLSALSQEEGPMARNELLTTAIKAIHSPMATPAKLHAGALACCALAKVAPADEQEAIECIWDPLLDVRDRDTTANRSIMEFVALCAPRDPEAFCSKWLSSVFPWLADASKREKEQVAALHSTAKLLPLVGLRATGYLDGIVFNFTQGLVQQRRLPGLHDALLAVVAGCVRAFGSPMKEFIAAVLEPMCSGGLSEALVTTLDVVIKNIPALAYDIRLRLLDLLSVSLCGTTFREWAIPGSSKITARDRRASVVEVREGRPTTMTRRRSSSIFERARGRSLSPKRARELVETAQADEERQRHLVMETIAHFDFVNVPMLLNWVQQYIVPYTTNEDAETRRTATKACASFLVNNSYTQSSNASSGPARDIMQTLLRIGIADPDPQIREETLACLDEHFDLYLVQSEPIRLLLFAINDNSMTVQAAILKILGRLPQKHDGASAIIMPALRSELIGLLTTMDEIRHSAARCHHLNLITSIFDTARDLAALYVRPAVDILLLQFRTADSEDIVIAGFRLLRRLSVDARDGLRKQAMDFVHVICQVLREPGSVQQRRIAVQTLTELVYGTACIAEVATIRDDIIDLLIGLLTVEKEIHARREIVKALGTIGASKPIQSGLDIADLVVQEIVDGPDETTNAGALENGLISDDIDEVKCKAPTFIADWLTGQLLTIWREPQPEKIHYAVVDALVAVYRDPSNHLRSQKYTGPIIERFLQAIAEQHTEVKTTCYFISGLGFILRAVGSVEAKASQVVATLLQRWDEGLQPNNCIIDTISALAASLGVDFREYFALVIPRIASSMVSDTGQDHSIQSAIRFICDMSDHLREWVHLVLPSLLEVIQHGTSVATRIVALDGLGILACSAYVGAHLTRLLPILVPLCHEEEFRAAAIRATCIVMKECGPEAIVFMELFAKDLPFDIRHHPLYVSHLRGTANEIPRIAATDEPEKDIVFLLDARPLQAAFAPPLGDCANDWTDWLGGLGTAIVKYSNHPHIRATAAVAQLHQTFQRSLINYGTYTIWHDLDVVTQHNITASLQTILQRDDATPEIHNVVLFLIDFLDRMSVKLGIKPTLRKEVAWKHLFMHRAVRYAEMEYNDISSEWLKRNSDDMQAWLDDLSSASDLQNRTQAVVRDLLRFDEQFHSREPDHAQGLLQITNAPVTTFSEIGEVQQSNLQTFDEALSRNPGDGDAIVGVMRSLHALQEWDLLVDFAESKGKNQPLHTKPLTAPLLATAAWRTNRFATMASAVQDMNPTEKAWYSAVTSTLSHDLPTALVDIGLARDRMSDELGGFWAEDNAQPYPEYSPLFEPVNVRHSRTGRSYAAMVRTQLLAELEEAGRYQSHSAERPLIQELWSTRFSLLQKDDDILNRCLNVQSIVLTPAENVKNITRYARILRKAGRLDLAFKVQARAMDDLTTSPLNLSSIPVSEWPGLTLERCRLVADTGDKVGATEGIEELVSKLADRLESCNRLTKKSQQTLGNIHELKLILSRALQCLGDYARQDNAHALSRSQTYYERSLRLWQTPKGYRKLATNNLALIEFLHEVRDSPEKTSLTDLAVAAIEHYVAMIRLASNYPLQDILGVLTVIFKHGQRSRMASAAKSAFDQLPIDCWLEAIPQLSAQLNYPSPQLQPIIESLMRRLGRAHPHTMIASLIAVAQYPSGDRAAVARRLMDVMRLYDNTLVEEAIMVNQELLRTSMTWEERCAYSIEGAAKYLFGSDDVEGLVYAVEEMCKDIENPQTPQDCHFVGKLGDALHAARALAQKCLKPDYSEKDLAAMWRKLHSIHKTCTSITKEGTTSFSLADVAPTLSAARNMTVSVPGTYVRHGGDPVHIVEVNRVVEVLSSKQRPRKFTMRGSDGKTYRFLLKAREDLRMDERCGQLFVLVNSLLANDQDSLRRHLRIVRYAVIPLNHNAGLCSWFERGDTLQTLCRAARRLEGRTMELELKQQAIFAPMIARGSLNTIQSVEAFELAADLTEGDELASILWRKSTSCLSWMERRTAYARSLATNSMIGYLLGLGDRHPSNILMDRQSGEIVHIDFGDSFEIATERDTFPERVPFRLTRQLIRCLGPTGTKGNFRLCSQHTMRVMREHKESVEAVFSSFLHDPLVAHLVLHPRQVDESRHEEVYEEPEVIDDGDFAVLRQHYRPRRRHTESGNPRAVTTLTPRAQRAIVRVRTKLVGTDFGGKHDIEEQVSRLITSATKVEHLALAYQGWCAFW